MSIGQQEPHHPLGRPGTLLAKELQRTVGRQVWRGDCGLFSFRNFDWSWNSRTLWTVSDAKLKRFPLCVAAPWSNMKLPRRLVFQVLLRPLTGDLLAAVQTASPCPSVSWFEGVGNFNVGCTRNGLRLRVNCILKCFKLYPLHLVIGSEWFRYYSDSHKRPLKRILWCSSFVFLLQPFHDLSCPQTDLPSHQGSGLLQGFLPLLTLEDWPCHEVVLLGEFYTCSTWLHRLHRLIWFGIWAWSSRWL